MKAGCSCCPRISIGRCERSTLRLVAILIIVSMWSLLQNGCDCLQCSVPGKPVKGDFSPRAHSYNVNDKVDYTCATGHALVGQPTSVCRSNGAWSGQTPLCMSNLAYQRRTEQSDASGSQSGLAVDGYDDTCTPVGPAPGSDPKLPPKRWWLVHFSKSTTITNINILLSKGSAYSLSVSIGKVAPPSGQSWTRTAKEQLQPFCHVQGATATDALKCSGHPVHSAQFVVVESSHHYNGIHIPFILCEVQVLNQFDVHSTQSSQVGTTGDAKESDPFFTTIVGIAVGATVASVSIVLAIVVVVCLLKRHLFKPVPTSEPSDGAHRGSSDLTDTGEMARHRHLSNATTPTTTYRSSDSRYSLPETEYTTANSVTTQHIYDYIPHQQMSPPSSSGGHVTPLVPQAMYLTPRSVAASLPLPPPVPLASATGTASNGEISVDNDIYRSSSSSSSNNSLAPSHPPPLAMAQRRRQSQSDETEDVELSRPLVIGRNHYDSVCDSPPPPLGPRDYTVQHGGGAHVGRELRVYAQDPRERGSSPTHIPETEL